MNASKLRPGVPSPTTESNKGGSVLVIWQNQARRLPEQCLFGDTKERYHQPIDRSGPPVYSEAWAKGIPRTPFSSLRDAAYGKHAVENKWC
ncbi:hypothetical protein TNCV_1825521 [Trichonephila clavipes]|nr:hypothetical protein TNCV_1825521 [Trichonephila clavipes]